MKKILYIATILLSLSFTWSELRAECRINNISLQKDSTFTKLVIYADAPFEYKHFTVEAKEGKPYRIVVDIGDAIHALPKNNFMNIPSQTITSIRTSQFTPEPSETVRIVMDVKSPIVYRVEDEKGSQLSLVISTPQDSNFPFWAANMAPSKEKEMRSVQAGGAKEQEQKEKPKPMAKEEAKPIGTKQTAPVQAAAEKKAVEKKIVKEEKPVGKGIATESKGEKEVESPSKPKLVEKEKLSQAKEIKSAEQTTKEIESQEKPTAPETSKVAQLKEKAEKTAEAIRSQVERIKPRGEVIEAVYKRKVITYESDSRRDPFLAIGEKINVEFGKAPQPSYESLKLVGVLKDASGNMGLLEDGEGYGYIMRQGDKVKNGEVIYVGDNKVVFQIVEYGWSKTVAIELSKAK